MRAEAEAAARVDRERGSGPCGDAEEGCDEKCSGYRPEAHHKGPVALEVAEPSRCPRGLRTSAPWLESLPMKIAVCVKEVPDAAVNKRIDPGTKRLDRSGEGALNHFDSQAVEEALKLKEAEGEGEVVLVSMGPAGALDSLRKALAMGADRAVLITDEAAAGSDLVATSRALGGRPREGGRGPRPVRAAVERFRRRRALGRGRGPAAAAGHLAGSRADGRRRQGARQAPDRVRLRRDRGAPARRHRGLGRDQRAALPVPEGDHGREEEAAGLAVCVRPRARWRRARRGRARERPSSRSATRLPAERRARSRTTATRRSRSPTSSRRRSSCERRGLPRASRRRAAEGLARRARQGGLARRRRRRRRPRLRREGARRRGPASSARRRCTWPTRPSSRRRFRSRGSTRSPSSSASRGSTRCSSRRQCSRRISPQGSRPGSMPA